MVVSMKLILKTITIIFIELINLLTRFNYNYKLSTVNKERLIMKAKDYKSITEILKKKYNKKFYDFEDFEDVLLKIKRKVG
jgi:hypothetical protein